MLILGIDPGYAIVGWGVVSYQNNKFKPVAFGAITTPAEMPFEDRLEVIYDEMQEILHRYPVEGMSVETLFFQNNQKTAMAVSQARGVILLAGKKMGIPIHQYTPLQVKQAVVGYGRAEKKQVMEMTRLLLGLSHVPKPDDTADALALAICHCHTAGSSLYGILRK